MPGVLLMKSKYIEPVNKSKNIIYNISLAVNCLLVFLLLFENRIVLPAWLQVAGRMHPMILHFPIVFVVLYVGWFLFFQKRVSPTETAINIGEWLLLHASFTSAVTALMGLFLSREEGYDAEALQWHKWTGVLVSLTTLLWYSLRNFFQQSKALVALSSAVSFFIILIAGHQGAGITHGQNFLLAPLLPEKKQKQVLFEDAIVFNDMVRPILQTKCMSCHNSKKAKGDLIMETEELLLKGGKDGKLWDTTEADLGLMMNRIHLPLETKKHMPPQGKPQLTDEEINILKSWIKEGADFKIKVIELAAGTDLRKAAEKIFSTIESDDYDFAAAEESKVQSLNNNYRTVYPLAKGSPALGAELFGASQFNSSALKDLLEVKKQLVSLNLNKMPLKDEDLKTISEFSQLRKLNLSFTGITGKTLDELTKLKELRHLSLSGNKLSVDDVKKISGLPQLSKLFLWSNGLKEEDLKQLQQVNKNLAIETGFYGDTLTLKLTPPILENEERIIAKPLPLKLKHYIKGATIRYTLDGSDPDSINSPVYNNNVILNSNTQLKAKAYKSGWYTSDIIESYFYASKYKSDSLIHFFPPDEQYKDAKNKTLIDQEKGDNNFRGGKWVGFRKTKMESLLFFNNPVELSSITLSTLIDIGGYIMPPASIEVWGGDDKNNLKLLGRLTPEQPTMSKPAFQKGFELKFKPTTVRYIKLIATPVAKLPAWHPGKGDKGWIFTDEIFVN
jgi:uncharacterized membrane protein